MDKNIAAILREDATTISVNFINDNGLIALAVFFGKTRLIDNIELHREQSGR